MDRIIVGKFSEVEQFSPIILMLVAIQTEVGFEALILSFSLTVRLRVKRRREPLLDFEVIAESGPEFTGEYASSV
jgi:hypothetical protein